MTLTEKISYIVYKSNIFYKIVSLFLILLLFHCISDY